MSSLCEDIVLEKVNEPGLFQFTSKEQHYFPMWGIPECRKAIASCLSRHLSPNMLLHEDNVSVGYVLMSCNFVILRIMSFLTSSLVCTTFLCTISEKKFVFLT